MRKLFLSIIILILFINQRALKAQDAHFSQFYAAPIVMNPAFTGVKNGKVRVAGAYRRQWESISVPFQTFTLSADYNLFSDGKIGDNLMGLGVVLVNDIAGQSQLRRTGVQMNLGYSQNMGVQGNYISIGFQGGVTQEALNIDNLVFESQFDGESFNASNFSGEMYENNRIWNYQFSAGMAWTYSKDRNNNYFLGISAHQLNRPNRSFLMDSEDLLHIRYALFGGFEKRIHSFVSIAPRVMVMKQGPHSEYIFGSYFKMHLSEPKAVNNTSLSLGVLYRWKDAFVPIVRFDYGAYGFGLSYDVNISKLTKASQSRGGAEITFIYRGNNSNSYNAPIPCPSF